MSHFYCFSFAPNPDWSRKYSPWNEIQAYAERCVDRFSLWPHIELGTGVELCRFDDESGLWIVTLSNGSQVRARHVIDGSGGLHVPLVPHIEGAETFEGEHWHSSLWRHDVDLAGKKIAVIGSAASAVQIVPEIAETAARFTCSSARPTTSFRAMTGTTRRLKNGVSATCRCTRKIYRLALFLRYDWFAYPIVKTSADNIQRRYAMGQFRRLLRKSVSDRHCARN